MAAPRDAIRSLRAVPSVPDRLARVEDAVRSLAVTKDGHAALLEHLSVSIGGRLDRIEALLAALSDTDRRRAALDARVPADRDLLVDPDPASGLPSAARAAIERDIDLVALVRGDDRLGRSWPDAGFDALRRRPEAVAAFGERIDVLSDGVDAIDATLVTRFVADPEGIDPAGPVTLDVGSLVVRTSVLASIEFVTPPRPSDVVRALLAAGPVVAVPVVATVGAHRDPAS